MKESQPYLLGMTIAVTHMEKMISFYANIFQIKFEEKEMYGSTLYSGVLGELQLLFCPAEVARNLAKQNRHQFDIVVANIQEVASEVIRNGGKLMGEITEDEIAWSVGIYDPDNNSMVLKQFKV